MIQSDRILIIAAHPDDEVLGCGGLIARMVGEGRDVFIAVLGEGITSRFGNADDGTDVLVDDLRSKSRQVAEFLGVGDLFSYDFPDNRFDTVPLLDVVKRIEEVLEQVRPGVVFTHHAGDLNIDHVITNRATLTATRPIPGRSVKAIYSYEVPSSTGWAFSRDGRSFCPNVFVDVSQALETKIQAMKIYDSEIRAYPHPRSGEALRATALRWGSVAGVEAAEAFELIRVVF